MALTDTARSCDISFWVLSSFVRASMNFSISIYHLIFMFKVQNLKNYLPQSTVLSYKILINISNVHLHILGMTHDCRLIAGIVTRFFESVYIMTFFSITSDKIFVLHMRQYPKVNLHPSITNSV